MINGISEAAFADCPLFRGMTASERQELLNLTELQEFPARETILVEGRSTRILWIIVEGKCQVTKATKTGGQQELARLDRYGVFGEMSFYSEAPHSASVISLTPVNVLRLSRAKFDTLLESGSSAAVKLAINSISVLSERLRIMDNWTCDLVEKAGTHHEEWRDFRSKLYSEWQF